MTIMREQEATFNEKMAEIARIVGGSIKQRAESLGWNSRIVLVRSIHHPPRDPLCYQAEFYGCLREEGFGKGKYRIEFSGVYPSHRGDQLVPYGMEHPSISVGLERKPEDIAKDLERRFLPKFLEASDASAYRLKDAEDFQVKTEALAGRVAKAIGAETGTSHRAGDRERSIIIPESFGKYYSRTLQSITVCGESVDMKIRADESLATALLDLIIRTGKEDQPDENL